MTTKLKPEQIEQDLLEIIGTHPAYIKPEQAARVLARCDSTTIARVLARCDSTTIARVLALGDSTTIARVLARCDSTTIARINKVKEVKPNPRLYSMILVEIERTQKAFDKSDVCEQALNQKNWHGTKHKCGTPHCAGGWIVTVTPGGYEMEKLFGMPTAAMIIARVSRPDAPLPNFAGDVPNDAALAFIKARAAEEPKLEEAAK